MHEEFWMRAAIFIAYLVEGEGIMTQRSIHGEKS
jgi:hypothetical protein